MPSRKFSVYGRAQRPSPTIKKNFEILRLTSFAQDDKHSDANKKKERIAFQPQFFILHS